MKKVKVFLSLLAFPMFLLFFDSCKKDEDIIPTPMTVQFEQNLSAYNIFEHEMADLIPTSDFHLFELASTLYSDYTKKQRLIKLPVGTQLMMLGDGLPDFPNGTILVKTFYYYDDARNPSLGKKIIETRLLIKEEDMWNVATYVWNDAQTEATLNLDGFDTPINWINEMGFPRSTMYHIPAESECLSCHQFDEQVVPLGLHLRNLNKDVFRNNITVNQLEHFQNVAILDDFNVSQIATMVDYNDVNAPLSERGRAYLAMNCGHCHHKSAWSKSAKKIFDFRYETSFEDTRIADKKSTIKDVIQSGRMPYLGKTIIHDEGVDLIREYIDNL